MENTVETRTMKIDGKTVTYVVRETKNCYYCGEMAWSDEMPHVLDTDSLRHVLACQDCVELPYEI